MMRILLLGLMMVFACGCSTNPGPTEQQAMNLVSLGMTKAEVISLVGNPDSTAAQAGYEYLRYTTSIDRDFSLRMKCSGEAMAGDHPSPECQYAEDRFIRFVDGKVESYGRVGDFDSTKDPAVTINKNVTIKDE